MNLIKRISASVSASMDSAVKQLENHEAIVDASIKRVKQSIAKTQAQFNGLQRQQTKARDQLKHAQSQAALWAERATNAANEDKDKALACLSQRNKAEQDSLDLKAKIKSQDQLLQEIDRQIDTLKSNLTDLENRRQSMRARQTVAEVNQVVANCSVVDDIEDTFERWEAVILENETVISHFDRSTIETNVLEQEFRTEEERMALEFQLEALVQEEHNHD